MKFKLLIKTKLSTNEEVSGFKSLRSSEGVFIMLINGKVPTIVGILTFMSSSQGRSRLPCEFDADLW